MNKITPIIGNDFPKKVCPLIDGACHTIDIIIFDWRVHIGSVSDSVARFNASIFRARARGVAIRVLANSSYVEAKLRELKIPCRRVYARGLVHAKMILIDRNIVVLGSHNFTQAAFMTNQEVSVALDLSGEEDLFADYFDRLWGA